ncbi:MAG: glycosyltransferase family 2 protein [Caulobacteraceae bacterium]
MNTLDAASGGPTLSVVAPCFNEEAALPEFVRRMAAACETVAPGGFEIVLVNDGSRDATWPCVKALAVSRSGIVGLNLSRHHGHQLAVTAGLARARGARVLVIDADLQDPPELLDPLMARMDEGHDVVYARRRSRVSERPLKRATAWLYYRVLRGLADIDIPKDTGDFRLMSRRIVDRLNAMPEQDRFLRGMVAWLGGAQSELEYDREPRFAGRTAYTFAKMAALAVAGVTSFSTLPLRLAGAMAAAGALGAVALAVYVIAGFLAGRAAHGWTSLALIVIFFSTVQLACLGILGAYVGRIFLQVKGRPLYLIDEIVTSNASQEAAGAGESPPRLEALLGGR